MTFFVRTSVKIAPPLFSKGGNKMLNSGFRWNDVEGGFRTFYNTINLEHPVETHDCQRPNSVPAYPYGSGGNAC